MTSWTVRSGNPGETIEIGRVLGRFLAPGHVLCIIGPLGSGKTVLTRGIVEGVRGDAKVVRSPSFTLVNEYPGPVRVYHVDLYRIESRREISELGLDEILGAVGEGGREAGAVVVEWGEKLGPLAPTDRLDIRLEMKGPEAREMRFEARGPRHASLLSAISGKSRGD